MSTDASSTDADPQRRLKRGELVHVKPGSRHPAYADLPMGGWSGTIDRIQKKGHLRRYWVRFSDATTERLHPVYADREIRDNGDCELWNNWVPGELLERGAAPPEAIEQPNLPPWAERSGERQIVALFGLSDDDPFPQTTPEASRTWHRFLTEHISLPRPATDMETEERLQLVRIVEPDDAQVEPDDDYFGLYCEVAHEQESWVVPLIDVDLLDDDPCDTLLRDYLYWYDVASDLTWRAGASAYDEDGDDEPPFGLTRAEFKRLWDSARRSVLETEFGRLPDGTGVEIESLAAQISQPVDFEGPEFDVQREPIRAAPRVGRNDPCPCGSGKKYKKCCLRDNIG